MASSEEKYWAEKIDGLEGLSNVEKEKSKEAPRKITNILGSNLSSIVRERHPITRYVFVNYAPWTWKWLVSLVEAIELVLHQTNGTKIINMLRNPVKFHEGLFHIYIATCILNSGLKILFLEEDNKNKIVDWKVTDPDTLLLP